MISKARRYRNHEDNDNGTMLWFWCPGCDCQHAARVESSAGKACWTWNGSEEKPTLSPSLLTNSRAPEKRCHCFVRDGQIQFLNDCDHALRGQTVPLPDLPDWLAEE